jgi:hypothetical protein
MELFLPSLFIFLLAAFVVIFVVPRFSPLIIATMSAALLAFGIYHHFSLFWTEYRTATWADQLKLFAPGIMLALILAYVIFAIVMFFTGASVPTPAIPNVQLPSANTATNMMTTALNNAIQTVVPTDLLGNNSGNTTKNINTGASSTSSNNKGANQATVQNLSKSFLAAI